MYPSCAIHDACFYLINMLKYSTIITLAVSSKYSPHSSRVRARYWLCLMSLKADLSSNFAIAVAYILTWSQQCNDMMTSSNGNIFCVTGPLCREFTGEFPSQRPMTRDCNFFFIYAWTKGWVNNWDAIGLRHHCTHYDVTVMSESQEQISYHENAFKNNVC